MADPSDDAGTDVAARLSEAGPGALSRAELLGILLTEAPGIDADAIVRGGRLLRKAGGRISKLPRCLACGPSTPGPPDPGTLRVLAAIELGRRMAAERAAPQRSIRGAADVHALMAPRIAHLGHEEFHVVLLNTQHRVLAIRPVSRGLLDASLVHPREVFRAALAANAAAIILVHNHPSGDPSPSPEDRAVTRRLAEAGKVMGVRVLDHVVIGDGRWASGGA